MAADHVLFIGWNRPVPGREKAALEVFRSSLAYYNELKASGQVASVEPVLLAPHGGDLNGFIVLKGDAAKLDAVRQADKFRDLMTKAALNVLGMGVIEGWSGESMTKQMERYASII